MIGVVVLATPLGAREPLGVFASWGAFRDRSPQRCFAIAEPELRGSLERRPFVSVSSWPGLKVYSQVHVRLRHDRALQSLVTLAIGGERFPLVAGRADAWAADKKTDAAIIRAMRSGQWLRISAKRERGGMYTDSYPLRGAATAIDAATIACARRR